MAGVVITGTGTDVGKTLVTAGLLRLFRSRGANVASMKPVQTGATRTLTGWHAPDLWAHWQAAGFEPDSADRALMAPYCYELPCSPHLAGRLAGAYPDIRIVVESARALCAKYSGILIEGAGGVLVPIHESATNVDLIASLGMPVVVVAHRGLGTINHTLLTIQALRHAEIPVLGVILNETRDASAGFIEHDNPRAIEAFGSVPVLGNVDYLGNPPVYDRFAACVPGSDVICGALLKS